MRYFIILFITTLLACEYTPATDYEGYLISSALEVQPDGFVKCTAVDEVTASGKGNSINIDEDGTIDLYFYNDAPASYEGDIKSDIINGSNEWQEVLGKGIRSRLTDSPSKADITIEFDDKNKYNTFQTSTLATMSTYRSTWGKPARMLVNTKHDLNKHDIDKLFAHEIGHALGMNSRNGKAHVATTAENRECVMYPFIRRSPIVICDETAKQIADIQELAIGKFNKPTEVPELEPVPEVPETPKDTLDQFTYGLLIAFRIEYPNDIEFVLRGANTVKDWALVFRVKDPKNSTSLQYRREVMDHINELRKLIK